ncbi:MAG TPA: bifunctional chorismate mutase/prephenate dehydrogenase [Rhodothermales bacterium]|jgi:chorismate mutase/prephenate dehydrogenase
MSGTQDDELQQLRDRLGELDNELFGTIARRQELVTEIGRIKASAGRATRDYRQEKDVIDRARHAAGQRGISGRFAEDLMVLLIRESLTAQEQDRVHEGARGSGRKVLIIGGNGHMGRWMVRFLGSQNFAVEVADPSGSPDDVPHVADWRESGLDHDIIVVATPLALSGPVLEELAGRKPRGVVFDISSLKTPLRTGLAALKDAGVSVTSIHPMFGPDTQMLSGRHVIFIDLGFPDATLQARELFASTMAVQVDMDLESHDRLVAYILGLSHATNIAFFTALAESGEAAPRLARMSSTTFDAQLELATRVAGDNPHLYYEIQSLNEYGGEALVALSEAVERIRSVVQSGNAEEFVTMMMRGREYLSQRGQR